MKVQGRIVNVKRHTVGWKIGGVNRTRKEAVQLARQGKVENVTVRRGGNDKFYIAALPGTNTLYDVPQRLVTK